MVIVTFGLGHIRPTSEARHTIWRLLLLAKWALFFWHLIAAQLEFHTLNFNFILEAATTWMQILPRPFTVVNKAFYIHSTCITISFVPSWRLFEEFEGASWKTLMGSFVGGEHAFLMEFNVVLHTSVSWSITLLLASIAQVWLLMFHQLKLVLRIDFVL